MKVKVKVKQDHIYNNIALTKLTEVRLYPFKKIKKMGEASTYPIMSEV